MVYALDRQREEAAGERRKQPGEPSVLRDRKGQWLWWWWKIHYGP